MIPGKKIVIRFPLLFVFLAFTLFTLAKEPVIKGKYLGQRRPGEKAERFAEGIVSSLFEVHSPVVFSPDGKEVYWSLLFKKGTQGVILFMKLDDDKWTLPENAPFSSEENRDVNPALSYDGKKLYFASRRPLQEEGRPGASLIWVVERGETGWGEPRPLDNTINEGAVGDQVSLSKDGTLYFGSRRATGKGGLDIYRSKWENDRFTEPENLGESINTGYLDFGPYISADQGYLVFTSDRPGGLGAADLYVAFQKKDGTWTTAINMGEKINSKDIEAFPAVSPDGKYLFFIREDEETSHVYWVSAVVIDTLKPKT
jgi:Tol biopolymer transport system component